MPENLYRRGKKGTWWGRIQVDGRDLRKSLRTIVFTEAKKRRKEWLAEVSHFRFHGEARHTWKEAAARWYAEFAASNLDESTAERYRVSLGQLKPELEDKYVDEITRKTIADIIRRRKAVSNATVRRDLTALSSVLRWCVAQEWRDDNPAKEYDRGVIRERREPITLPTDEAVKALVAECPGNFGRAVLFLRQTGMRQAEGVYFERSQFDAKAGTATLTKTKTNRPRVLKLSEEAVGTLAGTPPYLGSLFAFWHDKGEPYRNFASRFRVIAARAGFENRCHDLRHLFAVEYLRNRVGSIYDLQKHLGHTSIKTTEIYLEYLTPEQADAVKQSAQMPARV